MTVRPHGPLLRRTVMLSLSWLAACGSADPPASTESSAGETSPEPSSATPNKTALSVRLEADRSIEVTNVSAETVSFDRVGIERSSDEGWRATRLDVDCPCRAQCKRAPVVLKADGAYSTTWDSKDDACTVTDTGTYRAIVTGGWDAQLDRPVLLGVSAGQELGGVP